MKVLYVGGTGEISYECVLAGAAAGQDITVYNRGQNAEPLPAGVKRIAGELDDAAAYASLGRQNFDVVCQFLAYDMRRIERDLEAFGGRVGQYLFISTASCYQKPPRHYVVNEDVPLENPYWGYSQAKAAMERRLMEWHASGKLPVTIVRPSHTVRRNWPGTFFGNDDLAWRIAAGKPVISHGDGTSLWVLTHSRDFARPFVRLLGNQGALGEAFHITAPREAARTWDQIFTAIGEALGVPARLVHVPTETLVKHNRDWAGPLLGDKAWSLVFDNTKVKSVVGEYDCPIIMEQAMRMLAEHWRGRAAGFRPDQEKHAMLDRIAAEQLAVIGR